MSSIVLGFHYVVVVISLENFSLGLIQAVDFI